MPPLFYRTVPHRVGPNQVRLPCMGSYQLGLFQELEVTLHSFSLPFVSFYFSPLFFHFSLSFSKKEGERKWGCPTHTL